MIEIVCDQSWNGVSGTGRYSYELTKRLRKDPELQLREFVRKNPAGPAAPIEIDFILRRFRSSRVFWSPQYMPPIHARQRTIVTVHDLLQLKYSSKVKSAYFQYVLKNLYRRVDKIVTVSNFSKGEILNWTGRAEQDVVVVPNGLSAEFSYEGPRRRLAAPYFLYVGNHRPHKNLPRLIKAFAQSKVSGSHLLVFTGCENTQLMALAKELKVHDRLIFINFPDNPGLAEYYRGAVATLYVSLYEGFGLPIIESMGCGTPVISADIAAACETSGDDAVLVDPYNVDDIAEALNRIVAQQQLWERLSAAGLARAKLFSWDRSFEALTSVLSRI